MRFFGYELRSPFRKEAPRNLSSVDDGRGWSTVFEAGTPPGYFQTDTHVNRHDAQRNSTVFACQTLIAGDIAKLGVVLFERVKGVWQETESPAYRSFLRKPNHFQVWQQLVEQWILSKLSRGNMYALKERDQATRVKAAYILNPDRVTPLVAPDGSVYYRLQADALAGVPDGEVVVPASEIMHDRMNCLFHPLVGLSPLFASALAASQGLSIQEQSRQFFDNASRPGGMLVSPQMIDDKTAKSYKQRWEENFGGRNRGRTAVLGNGLKYEAIATNAVDSELVKQLEMSALQICSSYHVPAYKVGVGAAPPYQTAELLNQVYYDSCLQTLIEAMEALLDDGLELDSVGQRSLRARFDIDNLLRMDHRTQVAAIADAVQAGVMAPNEGRQRLGLAPVTGGDSPFLQQQNYSLEALAKRDAAEDPFSDSQAKARIAADEARAAESQAMARHYEARTKSDFPPEGTTVTTTETTTETVQ
jgi:HK97 family phage portal protein